MNDWNLKRDAIWCAVVLVANLIGRIGDKKINTKGQPLADPLVFDVAE